MLIHMLWINVDFIYCLENMLRIVLIMFREQRMGGTFNSIPNMSYKTNSLQGNTCTFLTRKKQLFRLVGTGRQSISIAHMAKVEVFLSRKFQCPPRSKIIAAFAFSMFSRTLFVYLDDFVSPEPYFYGIFELSALGIMC